MELDFRASATQLTYSAFTKGSFTVLSGSGGFAALEVAAFLYHKGSPARFARILAVTLKQDACVTVRVCLVAFPRKHPTHRDRIADVAAEVVTYRPAARRLRRAR